MDKIAIGFLADVLYIKGIICFDEFDTIQNATCPEDIQEIVERMLRSDFNGYKQGEGYVLDANK